MGGGPPHLNQSRTNDRTVTRCPSYLGLGITRHTDSLEQVTSGTLYCYLQTPGFDAERVPTRPMD
jgi:hypothetical protein